MAQQQKTANVVRTLGIHNSTLSKRGVHADGQNRMQCEWRSCANAVERAHTNSLHANDKLIQTKPHVRNTIASRKRQVVVRKGKSTIVVDNKIQQVTMTHTVSIIVSFN